MSLEFGSVFEFSSMGPVYLIQSLKWRKYNSFWVAVVRVIRVELLGCTASDVIFSSLPLSSVLRRTIAFFVSSLCCLPWSSRTWLAPLHIPHRPSEDTWTTIVSAS